MKSIHRVSCFFLSLVVSSRVVVSLSLDATTTRRRLSNALSASPAGKLHYVPELIVPEPHDATSILLQTNAIQTMSVRIRESKAAAVVMKCSSWTALQTFTTEQESARGNFPGPVPMICSYQSNNSDPTQRSSDDGKDDDCFMAMSRAGADGVIIAANEGMPLSSINEVTSDLWNGSIQAAIKAGIQPIPELIISSELAATLTEDDTSKWIDAVCSIMGCEPIAVVMTVLRPQSNDDDDDSEGNNHNQPSELEPVVLPSVPKSLGQRIPILGSVSVLAGENRLNTECARFKKAGFTGALLRSECLPGGLQYQPDLEIIGKFWSACIHDLKSTKSKAFSFRSKNNMEKSTATKWANYQHSVLESGALGDPNESYSIVDSGTGEYKGFA